MSEKTTSHIPDPHAMHRGLLPPGTPRLIGRYEVLSVLGSGTFGRVYLCFDPEVERYVAIKTPILPPESQREFLREARIVAKLRHPNICPVYDVGVQNDLPFIVMHYVSGGTLEKMLERGPLTQSKALRIAGQIAKGLEASHAKGVFHRDLKPANVLFDEDANELLLTDFGIARWNESGTATSGGVKGSPAYMAPEQWGPGGQFGDISARTDVYSLGVLLFRMLTGGLLFTGNAPEQMFHHCFIAPRRLSEVRPDLDPRLDAICLKALAKQPADRYGSAKDFAGSIAEYLRQPAPVSLPVVVPPPRTPEVELPLPGGLTMAFCWIPKGECQLGSPQTEKKRQADEDEERRGKFVTEGFWMGKYPVTQAEWRAITDVTDKSRFSAKLSSKSPWFWGSLRLKQTFVGHVITGDSPSYFQVGKGGADEVEGLDTTQFPVESVSWDMICGKDGKCGQDTFLGRLNALGGVAKIFGKGAGKFSLPHEDQWEYACRGGLGNRQPFYFGTELNGLQANIDGNHPFGTSVKGPYKERPTPGGFYTAKALLHPWGLFDMHGNVWEWCENRYDRASVSRVLRGGSWFDLAHNCRAACRFYFAPDYGNDIVGFRLVLSLDL